MPLGAMPMAHALWTRHLKHNPADPRWFNRDRFVLSAGHGSMLLYALLFATGYDLTLDDLKSFRQWESRTPGHPENFMTPGVEMATGPLGQGIATAVGMALAERFLAATFNRPGHDLIDHFTYVVCSDGDLMEGISQEACSLAGHQRLGKLICLYDSNEITIDGTTSSTFTENTRLRFEAMGWQVQEIDGMDIDAVDRALTAARQDGDRPSLIVARTTIGYGSPNKAGSEKSHGAPLGEEEVRLTKVALGLPDEPFYFPDEVRDSYRVSLEAGKLWQAEWSRKLSAYLRDYPAEGDLLARLMAGELGEEWAQHLPELDKPMATRKASAETLAGIAPHLPTLVGGSADLAESVFTNLPNTPLMQPDTPEGRRIAFGVREHGMMAIVNGMTLHGGIRAFGGTFLIFSDYCRPAIRLAALMRCPSIFVFSHDSIGLGEDGPTHQPIEQLASLRAIPNLNVMRPADPNETAACWEIALRSQGTPSVIVLTRQNVPALPSDRDGVKRGGYVLREGSDAVIVATGSEVSVAVEAAELLETDNLSVSVVSLPSWHLFEAQDEAYRASVLPPDVPAISVEAASTFGWARYADTHVGIDRFGVSAPGGEALRRFGFTGENVAAVVRSRLASR